MISTFYGIIIQMYWCDYALPHFHTRYTRYVGQQIVIDIRTLETLKGTMSPRAHSLILEWTREHRVELMEGWELCQGR